MNINNFPEEILEVVFRHLPLKDRKNASLVCRDWARLAFSRPCLESTELILASSKAADVSPLENSQRKYRFVCLRMDCDGFGTRELEGIRSVMCKFSCTIVRLRFVWDIMEGPFNLKLLLHLLELVPLLKELVVEDCIVNQYDERSLVPRVEMQSYPHLEKLTIPSCLMDNTQFDVARLAPNVKVVNLCTTGRHLWTALHLIGAQIRSMRLKTETKGIFRQLWEIEPYSLEKLHLHRLCSDLMEPSDLKLNDVVVFFSQCRALTVLGLELQISCSVIQLIANTCPTLKSLLVYEIEEGWTLLNILQQFENLKKLAIRVAHFEIKPSGEDLLLPKLKSLTLDGVEFENPFDFFHNLRQFAPGLQSLQFAQYDDSCNETYHLTVLKAVLQLKLPQLTKLILFDNTSYFPSHVFNQFNLFPKLKELRLAYYGLSAWNRSIVVPGVEKISLDIYELTAFQLRNLLKMFPSLVTLDAVEPEDPLNFGIDDLPRTSLLCDFNVRKRGYNILDEWAL
ncbi:uncharacterized protein LOC110676678 [Aedes aegypti]|uniref:Uncharacterized protein n=1 Tax=Aedes aegypti TaxID=7159 RepID=A0A6I8TYW9_AEDAE|nr:uncharacterized protein LOC110676678 [Aedes aegypti]